MKYVKAKAAYILFSSYLTNREAVNLTWPNVFSLKIIKYRYYIGFLLGPINILELRGRNYSVFLMIFFSVSVQILFKLSIGSIK